MPIDLQITMNGLMAYVMEENQIDVLILASREHARPGHAHHPRIDQHTPALLLPLRGLKGTSAPDMVLDPGEGTQEYGVWLLKDTFMEVRIDGKPPAGKVHYRSDASDKATPDSSNEGSLFWLSSIRRAAMMQCRFRPDCLPPRPNPHLVTAAVRIAEGSVAAHWSSDAAKEEIWTFRPPPEGDHSDRKGAEREAHEARDSKAESTHPTVYSQALADGIRWNIKGEERVEILLSSLAGHAMRAIVVQPILSEMLVVKGAISSKPATSEGQLPNMKQWEISHFNLYYDLVEPAPPLMSRRLPGPPGITTRESRCPGSSG